MAKRMLIDATHPDETRVVVLSGKTVEEFDYETASKAQVKGNIYLAKVTRVEPSLQAAFVDYGGNRHGFLPFSEIHPDYYRIPIADREALIAEEARLRGEAVEEAAEEADAAEGASDAAENGEAAAERRPRRRRGRKSDGEADNGDAENGDGEAKGGVEEVAQETNVDTVGGEEVEDSARRRAQLLRRYKIQEVVKRRQVMLVQVTKEERGNKGAALTTYLSLAGRYCVLMPNTAKGGGISRKISNASDRRRLKSVVGEMSIPEGMAVIVRTAGSERTKAEIKRDYEYLIRLWDDVRGKTLQSTAPCLIHEEASLIKRAIRDLYDRDMDDVLVEGPDGYKAAKDFMKMLMPSHARKVKPYGDSAMPLFHRYQVESQLDAMYSPQVQLRSGGSIVLNPTEALVAIDVNSGRSTRERHIEETALKTNLEAAEEVARQLRLRDLAGLIVIDFIDMEEPRHNREVERRLKDAMKGDRARIQLGRISPFGLLELSRQRLRPSLFETAMMQCHRCNATGYVRAPDAAALVVLRALTEEGVRKGGGELEVKVPLEVALHVLNEKRPHLIELEQRFGVSVSVQADAAMGPADFEIVRHSTEAVPAAIQEARQTVVEVDEDEAPEAEAEADEEREERDEEEGGRRRSRRRRGGRRDRGEERAARADSAEETRETPTDREADEEEADEEGEERTQERAEERRADDDDGKGKRRRRGRRGGRRRSRRRREDGTEAGELAAEDAGGSRDEAFDDGSRGFGDMSDERDAEADDRHDEEQERAAAARSDAAARSEAVPAEPTETEAEPVETEPVEAEPVEAGTVEPEPAEAAPVEAEAAEAEAEPKPAKRPRRSRTRKTAAKTEAAEADAESAAPAETAEAEAEAEKPKKPARRRRKTAAAAEAGEAAATAETGQGEGESDSAKPKAAAKKPATRTRRTRKKAEPAEPAAAEKVAAEEAATEEPAGETSAEPAGDPGSGNGAPAPAPTPAPASAEAARPAPSEDAEPAGTASAPAPAGGPDEEQDDKPRRRGWWNRLMS